MRSWLSARFIVLSIVGLAMCAMCVMHGLPILSAVFLVVFFGGFVWDQLKRARAEWPKVRTSFSDKVNSIVASVKSFYGSTPIISFAYSICMIVAATFFILLFLFGVKPVQPYVLYGSVSIFALAGSIEYIDRTIRILRNAWARTVGKLVLAGVGAVVYLLANAIARHVTVALTQADPKFFPSFVGLVSLVLAPILYVYGIALIAAILSFLEIFTAFVLYAALQILDFFHRYMGDIRLAIDLSCGRTQPRVRTEADRIDGAAKDLVFMLGRSLLFYFFTILIMQGAAKLLQWPSGWVDKGLRYALVQLEYNDQYICGQKYRMMTVSLENGHYSVAQVGKSNVEFGTVACPSKVEGSGSSSL